MIKFRILSAFVSLLAITSCVSSDSSSGDNTQSTYQLTTKFTGPAKLLSIESDTNGVEFPVLVDDAQPSSHLWTIEPNDNGLYVIGKMQSGSNAVLEATIDGDNRNVAVSSFQSADSQLWQVTPLSNGYCRLSSYMLGTGQSLDIVNDNEDRYLKFDTSQNVTGQQWQILEVSGSSNDAILEQCFAPDATNSVAYLPTSDYRKDTVLGFDLLINPRFDNTATLRADVLAEMEVQLQSLQSQVSGDAFSQLQTMPIWLEVDQLEDRSGQFHVSEQWLLANGYNPDKAGAVEISNALVFLDDARNLNARAAVHELAHAREFYLTNNTNFDFQIAFNQAVASGIYNSVEYANGSFTQAYAITNYKEYFAELSEAYFGTNDYYPFNRKQLVDFDPAGYDMVKQAWEYEQ